MDLKSSAEAGPPRPPPCRVIGDRHFRESPGHDRAVPSRVKPQARPGAGLMVKRPGLEKTGQAGSGLTAAREEGGGSRPRSAGVLSGERKERRPPGFSAAWIGTRGAMRLAKPHGQDRAKAVFPVSRLRGKPGLSSLPSEVSVIGIRGINRTGPRFSLVPDRAWRKLFGGGASSLPALPRARRTPEDAARKACPRPAREYAAACKDNGHGARRRGFPSSAGARPENPESARILARPYPALSA
jgi:hypothetical protein